MQRCTILLSPDKTRWFASAHSWLAVQSSRLAIFILAALLIAVPSAECQSATTPATPASLSSGGLSSPSATSPATASATQTTTATGSHAATTPTVIDAQHLQALGNLQVGAGSTIVIDFGKSTATLPGTLNNQGTIYAVSSNPSITTASFTANQITNQTGAIFTSVLPTGGLAGFTNLVPNLALLFNVGTFANYGTISSAGHLNINAATSFVNQGTITSGANLAITSAGSIVNQGVLAAMQNVTLMSAIGQISNTGTITANLGNINIMSAIAQNIAINNLGGVMQALNGTINVRDALFSGAGNINIDGGKFIAKEINLFGGTGAITANFGTISGVLNASADVAHVTTQSDSLSLGAVKMTGDPTFFNPAGAITLTGNIQVGESLAILANGNVTSTAGVSVISTTDPLGQGHDINIIAGGNLIGAGTTTNTINTTPPVVGNSGTQTILTGPGNGGEVDFSLSTNLRIDAHSTCANCSGGNVTIAAYKNGSPDSGRVLLAGPTTTTTGAAILTGGTGSGNNGSVTLLADSGFGTGISTGKIDTTGGAGSAANSGVITIQTASPVFSSGAQMVFEADGSVSSGNRLVGGATANSLVSINNDLLSSSTVNISGGGGIIATPNIVSLIPVGSKPTAVTVNALGTRAYVINSLDNTVSVIDTSTNTVIATIPVGAGPTGSVLTPDGSKLYVANSLNNTVTIIDAGTNTVIGTIAEGIVPVGITVDPQGKSVFVSNFGSNTVGVISTASDTVVATIPVGNGPQPITVNSASGLVFVGNQPGQSLSIIDPKTNTVVNTVALGFTPNAFGPCPCGTKMYIVDNSGNKVTEFLTATNSVGGSVALPAGSSPIGMAINPTGSTAYVTDIGSNSVNTFSTLTGNIFSTVPTTAGPARSTGTFAGFVGNNPTAYITNVLSNSVGVLRTPAISAPNVNLTSSTGNITVATGATNIAATATTGSVIITSPGQLVSSGGSAGTAYQLATTGNLIINGAITAPVIDLHAIGGTITNNSSITSSGTVLVLATPNVVNNGLITATGAGASVDVQSPNGILNITQTPVGVISSALDINFNPAFGSAITVTGGLLSSDPAAGTVNTYGMAGYTAQINVNQLNGEASINSQSPADNPSSVSVIALTGDLSVCGCISTAPAGTGSGGPITLMANGGNLIIEGGLQTAGAGVGNSAGNITLSALLNIGVGFGPLLANGTAGANGGNITITAQTGAFQLISPGFPGAIDTSSTGGLLGGGGKGGDVTISGNGIVIFAENLNNSSIDASANNFNSGGTITLVDSMVAPALTIDPFPPCACSPNLIAGNIITNGGRDGGRINLQSAAPITINNPSTISANGFVNGGLIQFTNLVPGTGPLTIVNNGLIQASSVVTANGIVGFNSGSSAINLTGTGTIFGSRYVAFGYLNPVTLQAINPIIIPGAPSVVFNNISAQQGDMQPFIAIGLPPVFVPPTLPSAQLPVTTSAVATTLPQLPEFVVPTFIGSTITPNDQNDDSVPQTQNQFLLPPKGLVGGITEDFDTAPEGLNGYRVDAINGRLIGPALITADYDTTRRTLVSNNANLLVVATDDITVSTRFGDVHIAAGSMVFIANSPDSVAIYNLHDEKNGAVSVNVAGQKVVVGLGFETLLTTQTKAEFDSVSPSKLIATRYVAKKSLSPTISMFDAEFSIPAALNAIIPLHDMRMSSTAADHDLVERVLRNAAILQMIASGHGPFKPGH